MRSLLVGVSVLAIASHAGARSIATDRPEPVRPTKPEPIGEAATIRVGKPTLGARIERMTVSLWLKEAETVATIGFDIEGVDLVLRDVRIPLALPAGSRATAMNVTIGGVRTDAFALAASEARTFYKETVERMVDPALLEKTRDGFDLHVFPIVKQGKQRVEITVSMPAAVKLAVEPVGHAIGHLEITAEGRTSSTTKVAKLTSARAFALPEPQRGLYEEPLTRTVVDDTMSLVAGRSSIDINRPTITIGQPHGPRRTRNLDKTIIRSRIKLARARLTYCYERELLRDPNLGGTVVAQFLISRAGKVVVKGTSGSLDNDKVHTCIAGVFESLEYPETDGDTLVNYPLTFHRW